MKKRITKENFLEVKRNVAEFLQQHPCIDCGEDNIVVLEFDHVRGRKKFNISTMINKGYSWETVKKEIDKCEVVCANCHKLRTAKQQNWYRLEYRLKNRRKE